MSPQVLDDFLDLAPFAVQVGRDVRTVRRWLNKPDGLPFTRLGNRILIHVPTARSWMLGQMRQPNPRRKGAAQTDAPQAA
jgi:hypothetical protein